MLHVSHDTGIIFLPVISAAIAALFLVQYAMRVERRARYLQARQLRMMADLSHNLQTPLAVLHSKLERLEQTMLHDGHTIGLRHSVESITHFVNDLLAFTYLEESHKKEKKQFSLSRLVQELCEEVVDVCEVEGIDLTSQIETNISLIGSERYIRDAVLNLVGNAIKYMGRGSMRRICISLQMRGGRILLAVIDTGTGVPENELPHIFERFYRGSNRIYGSVPGTGLGLAIVEKIVKKHGGTITVVSEVGNGSTFTLILPPAPQGYLRNLLRLR